MKIEVSYQGQEAMLLAIIPDPSRAAIVVKNDTGFGSFRIVPLTEILIKDYKATFPSLLQSYGYGRV